MRTVKKVLHHLWKNSEKIPQYSLAHKFMIRWLLFGLAISKIYNIEDCFEVWEIPRSHPYYSCWSMFIWIDFSVLISVSLPFMKCVFLDPMLYVHCSMEVQNTFLWNRVHFTTVLWWSGFRIPGSSMETCMVKYRFPSSIFSRKKRRKTCCFCWWSRPVVRINSKNDLNKLNTRYSWSSKNKQASIWKVNINRLLQSTRIVVEHLYRTVYNCPGRRQKNEMHIAKQ